MSERWVVSTFIHREENEPPFASAREPAVVTKWNRPGDMWGTILHLHTERIHTAMLAAGDAWDTEESGKGPVCCECNVPMKRQVDVYETRWLFCCLYCGRYAFVAKTGDEDENVCTAENCAERAVAIVGAGQHFERRCPAHSEEHYLDDLCRDRTEAVGGQVSLVAATDRASTTIRIDRGESFDDAMRKIEPAVATIFGYELIRSKVTIDGCTSPARLVVEYKPKEHLFDFLQRVRAAVVEVYGWWSDDQEIAIHKGVVKCEIACDDAAKCESPAETIVIMDGAVPAILFACQQHYDKLELDEAFLHGRENVNPRPDLPRCHECEKPMTAAMGGFVCIEAGCPESMLVCNVDGCNEPAEALPVESRCAKHLVERRGPLFCSDPNCKATLPAVREGSHEIFRALESARWQPWTTISRNVGDWVVFCPDHRRFDDGRDEPGAKDPADDNWTVQVRAPDHGRSVKLRQKHDIRENYIQFVRRIIEASNKAMGYEGPPIFAYIDAGWRHDEPQTDNDAFTIDQLMAYAKKLERSIDNGIVVDMHYDGTTNEFDTIIHVAEPDPEHLGEGSARTSTAAGVLAFIDMIARYKLLDDGTLELREKLPGEVADSDANE